MSEFWKRTLSGAVFVACVVGSILWNEWAFCGLFLFITLLAVLEFHRLVKSPRALRNYALLATILLWATAQVLAWSTNAQYDFIALGFALAGAHMLIMIFGLLDEIWNHSEHPLQSWGNLLISQFMIALPLAALCFLYFLDKWLLLALFVLIWVNDSGAYCVGVTTAKRKGGNHKMTPHISPKKSWEGLFGGVAFAIGAAYLLHYFGWFDSIMAGSEGARQNIIIILFALFTSTAGTLGDLMESLFKRSIGVKDSGRFLPGHGGVLDRFDSILLASPIITAFCWLCYFIAPLL